MIKSDHPAFRPIDVKMGPDGAIYIADWYNPIIQHGELAPPSPAGDRTHGRIWRDRQGPAHTREAGVGERRDRGPARSGDRPVGRGGQASSVLKERSAGQDPPPPSPPGSRTAIPSSTRPIFSCLLVLSGTRFSEAGTLGHTLSRVPVKYALPPRPGTWMPSASLPYASRTGRHFCSPTIMFTCALEAARIWPTFGESGGGSPGTEALDKPVDNRASITACG